MNTIQAVLRLRQVIRRQHKALSTEENYVFWLRRYMANVSQMPGTLSSEKKLEQFLTDLACQHQVAASTQNQALNAMLFFYRHVLDQPIQNVDALRATRPAHMRRAPSLEETSALLKTVRNVGQYPTNLSPGALYRWVVPIMPGRPGSTSPGFALLPPATAATNALEPEADIAAGLQE